MTYLELVSQVALNASVTQVQARRVIDEAAAAIRKSLLLGNSASIPNLGTFTVGRTAARIGVDPRTREPIRIKAKRLPKFRAYSALKDALN